MNILCTSEIKDQYVKSFDKVLKKIAKVTYSKKSFFDKQGDYDFILINWPEELIGWGHSPNKKEIQDLQTTLYYWSKNTKIIVTMHNTCPHSHRVSVKTVSELIYKNANIIIHLGKASVSLYKKKYGEFSAEHIVIPHVQMEYLDIISKNEAREKFGFKKEDVVILVFGSLRKKEEYQFIRKVFTKWSNPNKKLLISKYKDFSIPPIRFIKKHILPQKEKNVVKNTTRVDDKDIQNYFRSADIVFVPRLDTLNSGIVPVSAFFENIAIGGDIGNIQESLNLFNYPIFDVESATSATRALDTAYRLSQSNSGPLAKKILKEKCSPDAISKILKRFLELHQKKSS
ncbi:hypothetical protein Q4566_08560 [Tamlana sp. 2_MG-2023]|uniref:hypothetical protein n=1 Tax=unclassified Tamlana TaxID=2614803 RepID=UPI0026E18CFC|nr:MULTISPECIES: hypothetical protein [unclassified Tamlana]MDO6760245.1 hypothetical protein [Tamlana sp. 2_MG-2023]MDO6790057.1 hypothetical protein [Tamlana sp. 1_MG-2023]